MRLLLCVLHSRWMVWWRSKSGRMWATQSEYLSESETTENTQSRCCVVPFVKFHFFMFLTFYSEFSAQIDCCWPQMEVVRSHIWHEESHKQSARHSSGLGCENTVAKQLSSKEGCCLAPCSDTGHVHHSLLSDTNRLRTSINVVHGFKLNTSTRKSQWNSVKKVQEELWTISHHRPAQTDS